MTRNAAAGYRALMPAADAYLQKPWLRFYPGGVPANVEVPDKSVAQVFDEATERWADRAAVAFYGREVTYRPISMDEARKRMAAKGMPEQQIDAVLAIAAYQKAGGPTAAISEDVANILGRPPRTIRDFVRDHAAAFRR